MFVLMGYRWPKGIVGEAGSATNLEDVKSFGQPLSLTPDASTLASRGQLCLRGVQLDKIN